MRQQIYTWREWCICVHQCLFVPQTLHTTTPILSHESREMVGVIIHLSRWKICSVLSFPRKLRWGSLQGPHFIFEAVNFSDFNATKNIRFHCHQSPGNRERILQKFSDFYLLCHGILSFGDRLMMPIICQEGGGGEPYQNTRLVLQKKERLMEQTFLFLLLSTPTEPIRTRLLHFNLHTEFRKPP